MKNTNTNYNMNRNMEDVIVELANDNRLKHSKGFKLKKYQRINIYVFDQIILKRLLEELKFKDCGNIYDYDEIPKPDYINGNGVLDYKMFNRIAISKKYKSIILYNKENWLIDCMFLVSAKKLKKFTEITSKITLEDDGTNSLKGADLSCDGGAYLEIVDSVNDETKRYQITKKSVQNEHLVFDKDSAIAKVKDDINSFFTEKTKKLFKDLDIPHKRGIILYGEPGNGKSSMIRELVRTTPANISKIIIKKVRDLPDVLSSLLSALNGREAIIIMEDIDTMINDRNRSDILNIMDGVDIKSGTLILGTTNHLEKLGPDFVNRVGRFDKSYEITNPSESTRRLFFKSKNMYKLLSGFEFEKGQKLNEKDLLDCLIENSEALPMSSLKELVTNICYSLAYGEIKYVKDAIENSYDTIIDGRNKHTDMIKESMKNTNGNIQVYPVGGVINIETAKKKKRKKKKTTSGDGLKHIKLIKIKEA